MVVDRSKLVLQPGKVSSAYTATAVARARIAQPGDNVQLVVSVRGPQLRTWVSAIQRRFARMPVDASLKLKDGQPYLTKDRPGRALDAKKLTAKIIAALRANSRLPVRVAHAPVRRGRRSARSRRRS